MSKARCGTSANISAHEKTLDGTDACCKAHALCYENITQLNASVREETKYHSIFYNGQIQCVDNDGTPMRELCLCDRQAASCFRKTVGTFDRQMQMIDVPVVCEWEGEEYDEVEMVNDVHLIAAPIFKWDPTGVTLLGSVGVTGATDRLLNLPFSLQIYANSTLYVSDQSNNRVQKSLIGSFNCTTVAGQATGEVGTTSKHFSRSGAMVMDASQNLYVVDINNHRVQLWKNRSAEGVTVAGTTG